MASAKAVRPGDTPYEYLFDLWQAECQHTPDARQIETANGALFKVVQDNDEVIFVQAGAGLFDAGPGSFGG